MRVTVFAVHPPKAETGLLNKVYEQLKSTKKLDKDLTRTDLMVKLSKLNRKEEKTVKTSFLTRQDTSVVSNTAFAQAIEAAQQMAAQQEEEDKREPIIEEERDDEEAGVKAPMPSPAPERKKPSSILGRNAMVVDVEIPAGSTVNRDSEADSDCNESPMTPAPRGLKRVVSKAHSQALRSRSSFSEEDSKPGVRKKSTNMHALRNATRKKVIQVRNVFGSPLRLRARISIPC